METRDLRDLVRFSDDGPSHGRLYESDHLWSEVVCLQAAQALGPIQDEDSDAVLLVVAGEVAVQVDRGRSRMAQWASALVPKGSTLTVRNASSDPSVILLVAAPPPTPRPISD